MLLFDNDCLQVKYEEEKDLAKRLVLFYSAVKNFREYTKHLNCDIYFSHIKEDAPGKGLDDLFLSLPGAEEEIVADLLSLKPGYYFHTQNISDKSLLKLKDYFYLGSVQTFYNAYEDILGTKPFIFQDAKYQHTGEKLDLLKIPEAYYFLRIGDDYFKKVEKPNRLGVMETILKPVKKSTILDDYKRKAPNVLGMIDKFEGFCNVPDHKSHQEVIKGWFNMYAPRT